MLRIPFDGPSLVGRRAIVHTTDANVISGTVVSIGSHGIDLVVARQVCHYDLPEVRAVAAA